MVPLQMVASNAHGDLESQFHDFGSDFRGESMVDVNNVFVVFWGAIDMAACPPFGEKVQAKANMYA